MRLVHMYTSGIQVRNCFLSEPIYFYEPTVYQMKAASSSWSCSLAKMFFQVGFAPSSSRLNSFGDWRNNKIYLLIFNNLLYVFIRANATDASKEFILNNGIRNTKHKMVFNEMVGFVRMS